MTKLNFDEAGMVKERAYGLVSMGGKVNLARIKHKGQGWRFLVESVIFGWFFRDGIYPLVN